MTDEMKQEHARKVYQSIIEVLDERQWKYQRLDDKLQVQFAVRSEDMHVYYVMGVDARRQLLTVNSPMTFKMDASKRIDGAIITTVATRCLLDGNFDYDIESGRISFRLSASIAGTEVGKKMIAYFIDWTNLAVDRYNDRFEAVNSGKISVAEFITQEKE